MSHLPGKFVWFEHVSADTAAAASFYERLLGWRVDTVPVGDETYRMIMNGEAGIGGFRTAAPGLPGQWVSYLSVPDVDAAFAAAIAAGADARMAPTDFGPVGRGATITDPTGASLALWRGTQGDRPDTESTPLGDWYWNELVTPDETIALGFYEAVFGYTHDSMDMGAQGTYYLLMHDGKMRAGLSRAPDGTPPMWLPYIHVADADALAALAPTLGAQVAVPPTDVPGVGRFTMLIDPFGASIALMRSNPRA